MSVRASITLESPLGTLAVTGTPEGITAIRFVGDTPPERAVQAAIPPVLDRCAGELRAYFAGELQAFDVPVVFEGTDFQVRVWGALLDIPFGETRSYMDIARLLGDEGAVRAVGAANGQNPVAIVVPCHRVVGSDGSLTGYAGGLWRKEWLLAHEGHPMQRRLFD